MRKSVEVRTARPAFLAFTDAWASSRRVRDLSSLTQALSRVGHTCFERYAVTAVDVLIHGADPYVGLVAAWRAAQQGKSVILSFTSDITVDASAYRINARRTAHLPPKLVKYIHRHVTGLSITGSDYSCVLKALCALVKTQSGADGEPLVHVTRTYSLSPDSGVSQNYPDSHIFWPLLEERCLRDAAADDLRAIHKFVVKRLPACQMPPTRMTVGFVRARHLVLTSRAPGFSQIPWRCRVSLAGAATKPMCNDDASDYALRRQDIDSALAFVAGR